jgi:hypothetical protein
MPEVASAYLTDGEWPLLADAVENSKTDADKITRDMGLNSYESNAS